MFQVVSLTPIIPGLSRSKTIFSWMAQFLARRVQRTGEEVRQEGWDQGQRKRVEMLMTCSSFVNWAKSPAARQYFFSESPYLYCHLAFSACSALALLVSLTRRHTLLGTCKSHMPSYRCPK